MALQVRALDNVGVEVSGFDITKPSGDALAAELVSLWNEHGILLFRGQDVNPHNQIAASTREALRPSGVGVSRASKAWSSERSISRAYSEPESTGATASRSRRPGGGCHPF